MITYTCNSCGVKSIEKVYNIDVTFGTDSGQHNIHINNVYVNNKKDMCKECYEILLKKIQDAFK